MTRFRSVWPKCAPLSHFFESFTSTSSYKLFQAINLCYLKENKWSKLEKMANKPVTLGLILARFGSDLFLKKVFVGFTSTRCYTLLQAFIVIIACNFKENQWTKLEKMAKKLVSDHILVPSAQIWAVKIFSWIFFFKNLVPSVTRYNDQLSSWTIPEKTNDPILRKLSDGLANRRTDRRTRVIP